MDTAVISPFIHQVISIWNLCFDLLVWNTCLKDCDCKIEGDNKPRLLDDLKEAPVIGALVTNGDAGVRAMFIPTGPSCGPPDGLVSKECLIALVTWWSKTRGWHLTFRVLKEGYIGATYEVFIMKPAGYSPVDTLIQKLIIYN